MKLSVVNGFINVIVPGVLLYIWVLYCLLIAIFFIMVSRCRQVRTFMSAMLIIFEVSVIVYIFPHRAVACTKSSLRFVYHYCWIRLDIFIFILFGNLGFVYVLYVTVIELVSLL